MNNKNTALVLSAGGMFGAYQAGAFAAVTQHTTFDMVVGASVGALNGWPIAGGCTPEALISRWTDPVTGNSLRLLPKAGPRTGWFDPVPLKQLTDDLARDYTPRMPFALVTLELPLLKATIIEHPNVTAEYLRASASIPYFLPTVEVAGKKYLDGGIFEKCPVSAALKLGARRIIAVDCLPDLAPPPLRFAMKILRHLRAKTPVPADVQIIRIEPSQTKGSASDAVFWKEANVRRWIEMGRADAARALSAAL